MFNWHFLSILNSLDLIRLLCFGWDFPTGGEILGFWGKMTPKTSNERKTFGGRALPYSKLRLLSHCAWNYLYPVQVSKEKRQEGRQEEKSQEVYISRMCGATPSGRILTKLGQCVRLLILIKRAKFHRYNLRGFGAVRCWSFHFAIGNQGCPEHSAKRYRAAGVYNKPLRNRMASRRMARSRGTPSRPFKVNNHSENNGWVKIRKLFRRIPRNANTVLFQYNLKHKTGTMLRGSTSSSGSNPAWMIRSQVIRQSTIQHTLYKCCVSQIECSCSRSLVMN